MMSFREMAEAGRAVRAMLEGRPAKPSPRGLLKDRYLVAYTGHDSIYWVDRVQTLILAYFHAEPENPHPYCDVVEWMTTLVGEVEQATRTTLAGDVYDENMLNAYVLSLILGIWSIRLSHAKANDPRRPVALRKLASVNATAKVATFAEGLFDDSQDATYFTQPWDYPFGPDAIDGDFV